MNAPDPMRVLDRIEGDANAARMMSRKAQNLTFVIAAVALLTTFAGLLAGFPSLEWLGISLLLWAAVAGLWWWVFAWFDKDIPNPSPNSN